MNFILRLIYDHFYVLKVRCSMYAAWSIHEISLLILGLGYDQKTKEWNALRSFDIIGLEFTNGIKDKIGLWNLGVNKWLKQCIYQQLMDMTNGNRMTSAMVTFLVSAIWHGARSGVFLSFITMQLFDANIPSKLLPFVFYVSFRIIKALLWTFQSTN